jgi:hypothetical protein
METMSNENTSLAVLYGKLARITQAMKRIRKTGKHGQGYMFATETDIIESVRKAMEKENLAILPSMTNCTFLGDGGATKNGSPQFHALCEFEFTFACADTGATLTRKWFNEALDTSDKGVNKVATAALKYFFMKTFLITTGEPDEHELGDLKKGQRPAATKPAAPNGVGKNTGDEDLEPPATKTAEQVEAERKAEELKIAQQRLSTLVEGMEKNGISLDTAMQVLAIPEDKKYDFDLWKSHGATPKAIAEKVATQLAAGEKPATPKTAKTGISNDDATKLDALCGRWYDTVADSPLGPDVVLGELGKNFWSEFASYEEAKAAAMGWIIGKQLPIVVTGATYHRQYTALTNGLIEVRCYDFRKKTTEQLGDMWGVYTAEWVDGGAYPFDKGHQLIVGWAEKKTDKAQYYLAESIKPLPIADVPF